MINLLWLLLGGYALGMLFPLLVRRPESQNLAACVPAIMATASGIGLGLSGLTASDPLTASIASTIPLLTFAVRLDPLASFFVLTISVAGLAASIYAIGYVRNFMGGSQSRPWDRSSTPFSVSMTLVVIADNGFFFLIVWELMSLISYFLVVTEHEKAGRALRRLVLPGHDACRHGVHHPDLSDLLPSGRVVFVRGLSSSGAALAEGIRTLAFLTALIGFGTKAGIVPLHVWLPYAHPAAPSHVSALMSGVMIKTAIYACCAGLFRFSWWAVPLVVGICRARDRGRLGLTGRDVCADGARSQTSCLPITASKTSASSCSVSAPA